MNLIEMSVKRPIFITCIVISMLAIGYLSFKRLPVDMFPNVTFPVIMVNTPYPGAGPSEIETLVSKVLEDEFSSIPGIKSLRSISRESLSTVVVEFNLKNDISAAESQVRDRITTAKRRLPDDVQEPIIRRLDPANMPVAIVALKADAPPAKLFEIADEQIRSALEQINDVGQVTVIGGRKREIRIELDQKKLKKFELSASAISNRLASSGQNIPIGKFSDQSAETIFRALGEFHSLKDIESTIISFVGNDVPITIQSVGQVVDSLADETSRTLVNGEPHILLMIFKQSGSNTIKVADAIQAKVNQLNEKLKDQPEKIELHVAWDNSHAIRANVADVQESILIGIALTILVVLLFLGNFRSTFITSLALPNSLLGAFILMVWAGFTINVMSLLALSLAVGLLVDDAIVVRENIFRHIEEGSNPYTAAILGTKEVALAVIATTMAVISVFAPVGFLSGIVGQFFKEFGLTVCFTMLISLFDALTIAPMMSAYLAGNIHKKPSQLYRYTIGLPLTLFEYVQRFMDIVYAYVLRFTLKVPLLVIAGAIILFVGSLKLAKHIPTTFMSPQDFGEFAVGLEMPPATSLPAMYEVANKVDETIRANPEVARSILTVGSREGASNVAEFFVQLVPSKQRQINTTDFKERMRTQLQEFAYASPKVKDIDIVGGGMRPFTLNLVGQNLDEVAKVATALTEKLKTHPALKDVDMNYRPGKPEVQVVIDRAKAESFGVSTSVAGLELRTLIEGAIPAVLREMGQEYDIRVRLKDSQRNLAKIFPDTYVPNINYSMVRLPNISHLNESQVAATINRQDRGRYIQINADMAANGPGMKAAIDDINKIFKEEIKLGPDMRYMFVGQAESFSELMENMQVALGLAILFIFLVLASLYESFITPFTIMLVLPLAISGALGALYITGKSLEINSMIGFILLLGLASKNSILLVDYANQQLQKGLSLRDAILMAGKTRLRPILMTTMALIMGMLPIAIGLNEASKQRTSMGIAVIGGLISSTLLSLVVVPAAYSYIERFRAFCSRIGRRVLSSPPTTEPVVD